MNSVLAFGMPKEFTGLTIVRKKINDARVAGSEVFVCLSREIGSPFPGFPPGVNDAPNSGK
jgi:hypothetical protein